MIRTFYKTITLVFIAVFMFTSWSASAQNRSEEKLGWKLGAQAYSFRLFTLDEAIQKADSSNLRYVEAFPGQTIGGGVEGTMDFNMSPEKRKQVLKLFKKEALPYRLLVW